MRVSYHGEEGLRVSVLGEVKLDDPVILFISTLLVQSEGTFKIFKWNQRPDKIRIIYKDNEC